MAIRQTCPQCGSTFSAKDDLRGATVGCPKCRAPLVIGDTATPGSNVSLASEPASHSSPSQATLAAKPPRPGAKPAPVRPRAATPPARAPAPAPGVPLINVDSNASHSQSTPSGESAIASQYSSNRGARKRKQSNQQLFIIAGCAGAVLVLGGLLLAVLNRPMGGDSDRDVASSEGKGQLGWLADSDSQSQTGADGPGKTGSRNTTSDDNGSGDEDADEDSDFVIGSMLADSGLGDSASMIPPALAGGSLDPSQSRLHVDWAAQDRDGGTISIDGRQRPATDEMKYELEPGAHYVVLTRPGYNDISARVVLRGGSITRLVPHWDRSTGGSRPQPGQPPAGGIAAGTDSWLQDIEQAKRIAKAEDKDVMIAFMGSDWCGWCIRLAYEVFYQQDFRRQADKDYVLVFIDLPQTSKGKQKVQDFRRNEQAAEKYGVEGFPTVVYADGNGRVYATGSYVEGGVPGFMNHLREVRAAKSKRDLLFNAVVNTNGPAQIAAAKRALEWIKESSVSRFYTDDVRQWYEIARQHDPDNKKGDLEVFFEPYWTSQLLDQSIDNAAKAKQFVQVFEDWTKEHEFVDKDLGAKLYLMAGVVLGRLELNEEASEMIQRGLALQPKSPQIMAGLHLFASQFSPIESTGTGFVVAEDGYILTNHHVIEGDSRTVVRLPGREEPVDAKIIQADDDLDIALIKIEVPAGVRLKPLMLSDKAPRRAMRIAVFGYPLGDAVGSGLKTTIGIVSGLPDAANQGMMLLDCRVNPGNSGGPLCNAQGHCIGLVTAKSMIRTDTDSYGMARPSADCITFIEKHLPGYEKPQSLPDTELPWDEVDAGVSDSVLMVLKMSN